MGLLWQKSRSQAEPPLCTRPKKVHGLAFTGDGQRVVVHEEQGVTVVYDLATRLPVPGLVQTNLSWRMGFCPTNDRAAYQLSPGLGAGAAKFELGSAEQRDRVPVPLQQRRSLFLAFSDGRWLARFAPIRGVSRGGPGHRRTGQSIPYEAAPATP